MPRVFLPQILWHSKDNKRCDRVYSIDFQPNQKDENTERAKNTTTLRLATGGADEFVHIWQITIQDHTPQYTHFVNNNQNSDNKVEYEQPLSIKILARLVGHIGEVNSVRWSHDGRVLASGGEDRCIFLWVKTTKPNNLNEDVQTDYEEYWTRTHYFRLSNVVNSICWCPDDRTLSVSTEDGHVSLVDTQVEGTGKIRYFDGHTSFAQGVCLDPKNELLASLGSDQCLRVWKRRNQKQWKSVLVLKAARDRGDLIPMTELENNYELRKYSRYVFMSEELKTFFRRLDWSPDGRLLVAPTGIRYDKTNVDDPAQVNNLDSTVYTLYIFHRKLLNLGIPMITHQSPTGPFVVVKFCPIYLSIFDKKRQNFYNLLLNASKNKMKPLKRKVEKTDKHPAAMTNKINAYFTTVTHSSTTDQSSQADSGSPEVKDTERMEVEGAAGQLDQVEGENDQMMEVDALSDDQMMVDNEDMLEDDDSDNDLLAGDEGDEDVLTILEENENMFDNDNTPNNMDNSTLRTNTDANMDDTTTDTNLEDYNSPTISTNTYTSNLEGLSNYEDFTSDPKADTNTTLDDYHTNTADNSNVTEEFQVDLGNDQAEEMEEDNREHSTGENEESADQVDVKEEGQSEVKNENVKDEENGDVEVKKEEGEGEDVKNEELGEDYDDQRRYNLRKKRKSVIPLLVENTLAKMKKEKAKKAKKEKKEKLKLEDELQEEDYDTDLEEELSVPRFLFAAGTTDGSLCFFDTKEKSGPIAVLKNLHFCPITDISWSPDGYVCASSSSDGYITFVIFNKRELS